MSAKIDATINIWPGLFVGSNVHIELLGARTEAGQYVDAASVGCAITDATGAPVATVQLAPLDHAVAIGFDSYADGNYRGLLAGETPLVAGETYMFAFSCASPAFQFVRAAVAQSRLA